ncbi:MAG: dipeptidase PepE [Planctomycetota bacterium]
MKRLRLFSTSTVFGGAYLDYCADEVRAFFAGAPTILFVPYALHDRDTYAARARARFAELGLALESIHAERTPEAARRAVERADGLFVGGGNTFRLLNELYAQKLIEPVRSRVNDGLRYMGSSAGSNVACISIKTTNDMPIVYPPSFDALGLVPFNINPHYMDPDPTSKHMGETREQRIHEFHEMNAPPVVGLREGAWIGVEGDAITLRGKPGARVFRRGEAPQELADGARLDVLAVSGSKSAS